MLIGQDETIGPRQALKQKGAWLPSAEEVRVRAGRNATGGIQVHANEPDKVDARRLWLPWRPRLRLIVAYPRYWHWVFVRLERFDAWFTGRYKGRWYWPPLVAVVFLIFLAVRFLGLVAVLEITIIAFTASIYLVWGECMLLVLLFLPALLARLMHLLPWRLAAYRPPRRWTTRVTGWRVSGQTISVAVRVLKAGREPSGTTWTQTSRHSRIWI
jgi:hypothetical protein